MSALWLAPGRFFGAARVSCSGLGVEVSHRVAEGAPESVVTHTHEGAHFILVTGGDYVTAANGAAAPDRGALIYNPPGITHRDHFARGRGSFFAISLASCAKAALSAIAAPAEPRRLIEARQYTLAAAIAGLCARGEGGLSLEALCLELLGSLDAAPREPRAQPSWLGTAIELLDDRYAEELTVAEIARVVGVHPVYLARAFRRHLHCTPGDLARFRRLETALGLLGGTKQPIAEVALCCGFADQSHLNRTFMRCLGMSPAEYRASVGPQDRSQRPVARRFRIDKICSSPARRLAAWGSRIRTSSR